jgi:hypothetical protein
MENREAPESVNGFFYQRYCCIYYILSNNEFSYVLEEGYEDIDLIEINNQRNIIQVKYYGKHTESLTFNSGLYKVIISNYNKKDVDIITYYVFYTSENIYQKDLKEAFINKNFYNIGKYIILLIYKNINNSKITINITNINNIDIIYKKHKTKITKTFQKFKDKDKDKNKYNIFIFFNDKNNCDNYFSKFNLKKGFSYTKLHSEINNKINTTYSTFINTNNNENKELRITLIKNTILNLLTDKMFFNIESQNRKIKLDDIKSEINKKITTFTNPNNLYYELLKQTEKIICDSINNKHIEQLNINGYINQIKNISINSIDNVSFYICLLNNKYDNLKKEDIYSIKNYLLEFIMSRYKFINIEKKFKLIKYLNMIIIKTSKNYNVAHEKLINLIDDQHKINKFF